MIFNKNSRIVCAHCEQQFWTSIPTACAIEYLPGHWRVYCEPACADAHDKAMKAANALKSMGEPPKERWTAYGEHLDRLTASAGVIRKPGEADDSLRQRALKLLMGR